MPQRVADEFAAVFVRKIAPSFKNSAFKDEQEWRLVFIDGGPGPNSMVKFRSGKSAITPYLPFKIRNWQQISYEKIKPFAKDEKTLSEVENVELLSTLMIRPHFDDDFVEEGFKRFVESLGFPRQLVTKSNIPFRSY